MKNILLLASPVFLFVPLLASAQPAKGLKKVLELKIPRAGGAHAANIAWHPVQKKYYAAMAGNIEFCMGVFDNKGKLLSEPELKTSFDVRGLWYNPAAGALQMNGYNDFGWGEYKLNTRGIPSEVKTLFTGLNQPDEQSAGAFNPKEKVIYFFNGDGNISRYDLQAVKYPDDIELHLGQIKENEDDYSDNYDVLDQYNSSTVIYTGASDAELGLLNYITKEIELYSIKTGYKTRTLTLPDDAPTNGILDFSYCNGIYWLFDTDARIWKGYK